MSIPEPWPDAGPTFSEDAIAVDGRSTRMNQPWRALVAVAEVLLAALLVVTALWSWRRGIVSIPLPRSYGVTDVVTRLVGSWLALSVALTTVAGLLVVNAVRQAVLAWGTGRRRKARSGADTGRNAGET